MRLLAVLYTRPAGHMACSARLCAGDHTVDWFYLPVHVAKPSAPLHLFCISCTTVKLVVEVLIAKRGSTLTCMVHMLPTETVRAHGGHRSPARVHTRARANVGTRTQGAVVAVKLQGNACKVLR